MNTCIIPMRSGSKRLKDKNIIDFFGEPIFTYPLETAIDSGIFDKIILAVDKKYNKIACQNILDGLKVDVYIRDETNSNDDATLYDLVEEVTKNYNLKGNMCILYSTSVLTTEDQLRRGKRLLKEHDVVFPILKHNCELNECGNGNIIKNDYKFYTYSHADAWFWFRLKEILELGKKDRQIIHDNNGYIVLKEYEAQPVHTLEDIKDLKKKYIIKINGGS